MKNTWKWLVGIVAGLVLLFGLPLAWRLWASLGGYGMMGAYGGRLPFMHAGFGMMGFGMLFMWLIPFGLLILIGLGIAWLVRSLQTRK